MRTVPSLILIALTLALKACGGHTPVHKPSIEVGYAVTDIETGRVVRSGAPDTPFIPASTTKIVTAIAALDTLPSDHRFVTKICANQSVNETGTINGDLFLIGGGDPNLTLADLLSLAEETKRSGLRQVTGAFQFDGTIVPSMPAIEPMQPQNAVYNTALSGLLVAENAVRREVDASGDTWTAPLAIEPTLQEPSRWFPAKEPDLHAARVFQTYASRLGLAVPTPERGATKCEIEIAHVESETRDQLISAMLEKSSNPMAELLGFAIDRNRGHQAKDLASAAGRTTDWLKSRFPSIDWDNLYLPNHSGLSADARITPRQMSDLIAAAMTDPKVGFRASLLTPAGWRGHLKSRLIDRETTALVWAKTGTMHYGIGLAGIILNEDGRPKSFAIYAMDRDQRAAYDALGPTPSKKANDQAKAWDETARLQIDETLMSLIRKRN